MKTNIYKNNTNLFIIVFFMLLSIIGSIVVFHMHILIGTWDTVFHAKMALELKDDLLHGQLLPYFSFNYFHGSSIMSMYPYLCLLPLSLIFMCTSSIIRAYAIFFSIIVFCSLMISYYSSLRFSKSRRISSTFAIVYSTYPLFMNFYSVGDIGITVAISFLPLVIFGFIDILNGSKNYFKLLLGLFLISQCELPVIVVVGSGLFLWFLFNIRYLNKIILKEFLKVILLYILLTSIIWAPLFNIVFNNNIYTVGHGVLKSAYNGDYVISLSIFSWIALILFMILAFRHKLSKNRLLDQMFLISLFLLIIMSKLIPWNLISSYGILKNLKQFQMMGRFIIIPNIFLSYLFSVLLIKRVFKRVHFRFKISSITLITIILSLLCQSYIYSKAFKPEFNYIDHSSYSISRSAHIQTHMIIENRWNKKLINGYLNNHDYYPADSISQDTLINKHKGYFNNHILNVTHDGYNTFLIHNKHNVNHLTLPLLHYNNEHLKIYLNGHNISYSYNNHKLITINNVKDRFSKIHVVNIPNIKLIIIELVLFFIGLLWSLNSFIRIYQ